MSEQNTTESTTSSTEGKKGRCTGACKGRKRHGRGLVKLLVFLGLVGGAALIIPRAFAGGGWSGGHGCHSEPASAEDLRERADWGASWLLDEVDATDAQRDQIGGILDEAAPQAFELRKEGRALHEDLASTLSAPTVDRAALEEIRLNGLDLADRASSKALDWLARGATVLTPEQRADLKEKWEDHR